MNVYGWNGRWKNRKKGTGMAKTEKNKSVFDDKTVSDDYKTGGAYKAILNMFAEQLEDEVCRTL